VGLNFSPEEGRSHGIVWVGAEVDSVNGDFSPGFLGWWRCRVFEDGGGRASLSGCENISLVVRT